MEPSDTVSEYTLAVFLENPGKRKNPDEDVGIDTNPGFIVEPEDGDSITKQTEDSDSDKEVGIATKPGFIVDDNVEPQDDDLITKQTEDSDSIEEDPFHSVCAICDNGGVLICCDGKCFRSFHLDRKSEEARESRCESLDKTSKQLKDAPLFKCENCQYNLHQCYVCGKLGSSDKSSNAEVFRCSSTTCGHFYHPQCVASLLKNVKAEQQALKEKFAKGYPFICPAHKCAVCKQTENEKVEDLQFAICRRCPTSYHRKCLPRDIIFDDQIDDEYYNAEVRAWNGLLSKSRALIYCMKHEIIAKLGTPARTLKFKNILQRRTKQPSEPLKKKKKVAGKETESNVHLLKAMEELTLTKSKTDDSNSPLLKAMEELTLKKSKTESV